MKTPRWKKKARQSFVSFRVPLFIVHPGWVISANDGQRHWISFTDLCRLYSVPAVLCVDASSPLARFCRRDDPRQPVTAELHPRRDGNYGPFWQESIAAWAKRNRSLQSRVRRFLATPAPFHPDDLAAAYERLLSHER